MIPVVAVKREVPIGFAFLLVEGEKMGSGFTAILGIGVSSQYQGMGVGFSMMHFLVVKAKEWRVKHIILEVLEDNPRAIALYRKCGFRTTRRPVKKELWDGENLSLIQMAANVGSV
jgi:ribosomal protein S18 acetylase RimI-like enzyme